MIRGEGRAHGGLGAAMAAAVAVLLLLIFLLYQWSRPPGESPKAFNHALVEGGRGRVILLLADRLAYGDLLRGAGPHLSRFFEEGAVALMNVRTGRTGSESGYLSLGAAARAAAGPEGRNAFSKDEFFEGEEAGVIYERCTGSTPGGAVFMLQTTALQEKNSALPYPVTVGRLGEMLKERGLTAAVWGNADGATPNRSAVMVAMDSRGLVSAGAVGPGLLQEDPLYPYGVHTDVRRITAAVTDHLVDADLHVVEFGDSSRLDEYWPYLTPARGERLFTLTMANLDRLLGELQLLVDGQNCSLLLVTPSLPQNRPAGGEQLAPLCLLTAGGCGPGLVVSPATRRPGLVQNTDLPRLLCSLLEGAAEKALPGLASPFGVAPEKDPLDHLDRFSARTTRVFNQRSPLLKGYVALLVAALLAAPAALLLKARLLLRPLSAVIRLLLFVPPALLLLPGLFSFPLPQAWQSGLVLLGSALLPALLLQPLQKKSPRLYLVVLGWGIALVLLIDTLAGAPLQQLSLFSYDPAGGARYYGMGNEFMGVLIGAALLGTVSLKDFIAGEAEIPHRRAASALQVVAMGLFYGTIIFILAAPNFGANLGGTFAAATAFGVAWREFLGMGGQKKKVILSVTAFLFLAAALLWALNSCLPQLLPSHVGLFGEAIRSRGAAAFRETAWRKMGMNLKLIRYSIWGRALVTLVGLCAVLFFCPGGLRQRLQRERPDLIRGVAAALAGAGAALLTNDSGVVAAATILLYAVPPLLLEMMQKSYTGGQHIEGEGQD